MALHIRSKKETEKAKHFYFIRHTEGTHNRAYEIGGSKAYESDSHYDARLTDHGLVEAINIAKKLRSPFPELVISSSLTRAIQTARETALMYDARFVVHEYLREKISSRIFPCNMRRSCETLRQEFPEVQEFAFEIMDNEHEQDAWGRGRQGESAHKMIERFNSVIFGAMNTDYNVIAVFSHGYALEDFFSQENEFVFVDDDVSRDMFCNGEIREVFID